MCDYQGYEFGGGYLDSVCIEGRLFDADHCDSEGNLYEPMDDIGCPKCNVLVALDYYADSKDFDSVRSAWSLIKDIRNNRGLKTEWTIFARWAFGRWSGAFRAAIRQRSMTPVADEYWKWVKDRGSLDEQSP